MIILVPCSSHAWGPPALARSLFSLSQEAYQVRLYNLVLRKPRRQFSTQLSFCILWACNLWSTGLIGEPSLSVSSVYYCCTFAISLSLCCNKLCVLTIPQIAFCNLHGPTNCGEVGTQNLSQLDNNVYSRAR